MTIQQRQTLRVIDSHTAGEPTRVVIDGAPDLGLGTMAQRLAVLRDEHDWVRRVCCTEPRGSDTVVGALLCEPVSSDAAAGVIFFNNVGYLSMCGHGTMGLAATLAYLGRITPGVHTVETPVGDVEVTLHDDRHGATVRNVASYRAAAGVPVDVPGLGRVHGDLAWGGNWFFLVSDHGQRVEPGNIEELTRVAWAIRRAIHTAGITGEDGGEVDHIELLGPPSSPSVADSRSFVLCPGGAYDRSPCGTGTSAKVACLAADGRLATGEVWRQQSIIGSVFEASYELSGDRVIPSITGRAYVNAEAALIVDPADPYGLGITMC
ncbi:MAG: 4-hydroxyproline epimerase [Phycisphaerales bacterium JB063]